MAAIKVSIELDDAELQKEIREAAQTTKREFDKIDPVADLRKKTRTAFDQIGQDARNAFSSLQQALPASFQNISSRVSTGFNTMAAAAQGLTGTISGLGVALGVGAGAFVAFAAAATAGSKAMIDAALEGGRLASNMVNLSNIVGINVATIEKLQAGYRMVGGNVDSATSALSKFSALVAQAATGEMPKLEKALTALGVNPIEAQKDLDKAFRQTMNTLALHSDRTEAAAVATQLFSREGVRMVAVWRDLITEGSSLNTSLATTGGLLGGSTIENAAKLDDAIGRLRGRFADLQITLAATLGPSLIDMANSTITMLNNMMPVILAMARTLNAVLAPIAGVMDARRLLGTTTRGELLPGAKSRFGPEPNLGGFAAEMAAKFGTPVGAGGSDAVGKALLALRQREQAEGGGRSVDSELKRLAEERQKALEESLRIYKEANQNFSSSMIKGMEFVLQGLNEANLQMQGFGEAIERASRRDVLAPTPTPPIAEGGIPGAPTAAQLEKVSQITVQLTQQTAVYRHEWEQLTEIQQEWLQISVEAEEHLSRVFGVDALEHRARILDAIAERTKTATQVIADAQISAMDAVFDVIDTGFARMTASLGAMGRVLSQVLSDISKMFLSRIFQNLFLGGGGGGTGGGGGFGGGSQGGGIFSFLGGLGGGGGGGGGIAGTIQKLFSGGGSGILTPAAISSTGAIATIGYLPGLGTLSTTTTLGTAAGAGGAFAGLGGALAGLLPLAGAFGGAAVGGKSLAGQIIGGIGGTALGIGGALLTGATTFGLSASAIALLTNPFTLIAGGALLVGAYFLGKAKQRRADEQLADSIWSDEAQRTRELIAAVNSDRIDGSEALAQWSAIRSQTVAGLNQIKTKSVRESRLTNQIRDLDQGVVAELRAAVERQAKRRGVLGSLVPEFQSGGIIPGFDRGFDSVVITAQPGEMVLNRNQQAYIKSVAGPKVFQKAGVPGFQFGGTVTTAAAPSAGPTVIELHVDEGIILGQIASGKGERVIVRTVQKAQRNGDL